MDSPPPLARRLSPAAALLAAVPAIVLAGIQIHWSWPFFSDDSFISLRFADRLLSGEGLTWSDGERVEGYSNLLWVLLCAGLGAVGVELVTAARLLGMACTVGALWLLAAAARPRHAASALVAAAAPLMVAGTTQVMGWTAGGLEGPLVLLLLVWGLAAVLDLRERHDRAAGWPLPALVRCGVPFALLVLTRPDGGLWAATAGLGLGLAALPLGLRGALVRMIAFGALPALALGAQMLFRLLYYRDWVPNTAHVKVEFGEEVWSAGWQYIGEGLWTVQGLAWAAVLATGLLALNRRGRRAVPLLLLPLGGWLLYLTSVGGDHFPGYRLMHPALAPLALLVAWSVRHLGGARTGVLLTVVVGGAATAANVTLARTVPLSVHMRAEKWEWQGKVIGEVLGAAFRERRPLVAVDAAGALPYYSRLPALDMLGLCDRTIARTPTPQWAAAAAEIAGLRRSQGHLRGNGDYVMDRAPDLIQFSTPPGMPLPVFLSGLEFEEDHRFLDGYRLVVLDIPARPWGHGLEGPITSYLWVRVEGRAGVTRTARRIEIPGHLLAGYRLERPIWCRHQPAADVEELASRRAVAIDMTNWVLERHPARVVPADDGALELLVRNSEPLALELEVPPGAWTVDVEPASSGFTGEFVDGRVTLTPTAATRLPAIVRRVVLSRSR